jgi:hypothetical protein
MQDNGTRLVRVPMLPLSSGARQIHSPRQRKRFSDATDPALSLSLDRFLEALLPAPARGTEALHGELTPRHATGDRS